jgi:hypothetical protein
MGEFLGVNRMPRQTFRRRLKAGLLLLACRCTEGWDRPDLSRFYPDILSHSYLQGVVEGFREKRTDFHQKEISLAKDH